MNSLGTQLRVDLLLQAADIRHEEAKTHNLRVFAEGLGYHAALHPPRLRLSFGPTQVAQAPSARRWSAASVACWVQSPALQLLTRLLGVLNVQLRRLLWRAVERLGHTLAIADHDNR